MNKDNFKVYLTYDEHRGGGEIRKGEEDHQFPCHEDEWIVFTPGQLFRTPSGWCETIALDFDPADCKSLYLVIVRYSTGSSFGHTTGAWQIEGAYKTEAEAEAVSVSIEENKYEGHAVWNGYFERLESVYFRKFPLND